MRHARRLGAAIALAAAITTTIIVHQATPAAANTTIGWVLDANGSVHCYVAAGTNNHVICDTYWPGSGGLRGPARINDWLPYACLGGAYMIPGDNNGTPAQLVYQNAPGYYCGRVTSAPLGFRVGTCWNGSNWYEGTYTNSPGYPYRQQMGNIYPQNYAGTTWNTPWWPGGPSCNDVGHSKVGHSISF